MTLQFDFHTRWYEEQPRNCPTENPWHGEPPTTASQTVQLALQMLRRGNHNFAFSFRATVIFQPPNDDEIGMTKSKYQYAVCVYKTRFTKWVEPDENLIPLNKDSNRLTSRAKAREELKRLAVQHPDAEWYEIYRHYTVTESNGYGHYSEDICEPIETAEIK